MQANAVAAAEDFWLGDVEMNGRRLWLSPMLIGLGAPVVLGLVVAPQLLFGASWLIVGGLVFLLVVAVAAYALSVLAPGEPGTLIVSPATRKLSVIRYGMLASSTIEIPFSEVARFELAHALTREQQATPYLHVYTKSGEVWSIAADVTRKEVEDLGAVVGLRKRAR